MSATSVLGGTDRAWVLPVWSSSSSRPPGTRTRFISPKSSLDTAESPVDVTGRAGQEPPDAGVAEELKPLPHVRARRARVRERREISADAAVLVEDGEDFPRVADLVVADHLLDERLPRRVVSGD
jgi:hypothetical protein